MEDRNSNTNNEPAQQQQSTLDQPPTKRRRTRLEASCERCRARKIRCDKNQPKCEACVRAEAVCDRSKPASRNRKVRSSSTESASANPRKSKSPSTTTTGNAPKLYPIGDGTWAPLEYILSLRTGSQQAQDSSQGQQSQQPDQDQAQNRATSAERRMSSSVPRNLDNTSNSNVHRQGDTSEHYQQASQNHNSHQRPSTASFIDHEHPRRPDHPTSFAQYENDGGFEFPTSTARLHRGGEGDNDGSGNVERAEAATAGGSGGGGGIVVDGQRGGAAGMGMTGRDAYGPFSSRIDPMLVSSMDTSCRQQTSAHALPNTQTQQQLSNHGVLLSTSIGGNLREPVLPADTNEGIMMNHATSSHLPDIATVARPDNLRNHLHQPQDSTSSNLYLSYNAFPLHVGQDDKHQHRAATSELAFTPQEIGLSRILSPDQQYEQEVVSSVPRSDDRENDYFIHSQDHRKKFLGASSSQVFVKWLDEESTSGGIRPSSHLKHGMAAAEEMILPGQLELCHHPLPPQPALETYVATYFRTIHILYPVLDESWLRFQLSRPKGPQTAGEEVVTPVVWLVVSLGASMTTSNHQSAAISQTYLDLAWKALSVIIGKPFRSSVQALVLMAVALRLRSKDGVAWSMIGSAIRIGQSLGLHRHTVGPDTSLDARIWYATISLDAIGSIESGRPMTIRRSDYSTSLSSFKDDTFTLGTNSQPVNVLAAFAELCQEIAYIVQVLFPTNPATSSEYEIEVLEHIGVIHMRLETWAKSLPLQIRPGGDTPVPGPFFPFAAMLHMQYHQIIITLHRLSLIDHPRLVLQNLTHPLLRGRPFLHFLEASESICTQSARAILTTLDASARTPSKYHLWTFHSIGTAIFALSLFTCKHPTTWRARADVEMLSHATRAITKGFLDQGLSPQFVDMYEAVNRMTRKKVMESFEPESVAPDIQENLPPQAIEPIMDENAVNIDELWSTLFGLGNTTEHEMLHSRDEPSYRF